MVVRTAGINPNNESSPSTLPRRWPLFPTLLKCCELPLPPLFFGYSIAPSTHAAHSPGPQSPRSPHARLSVAADSHAVASCGVLVDLPY